MKVGLIALAVLLSGGVVLSIFGFPLRVSADDVEVVLTETNTIQYVQGCYDHNTEPDAMLRLWNDYDDSFRSVFRANDQTGGGNVTQVLFKIYYYDDGVFESPAGEKVRLYRLTKTFDEAYVTATHRTSSSYWTSCGGDYTTINYAEATMPSSYGWITFDITDMAMDEWEDNDDLYFIMRCKYETGTDEDSWWMAWFRSDNYGTASYRPRIVVTYEDEVQVPTVVASIDEIGDDYLKVKVDYNCYDWTNVAVYAQASLDGAGSWIYESTGSTGLSGAGYVIETISGLSASTAYDVRGKLVYDSPPETVYSSIVDVTTRSYIVPVWSEDVDEIQSYQADLHAVWTGNTDLKQIMARCYYRKDDSPEWTMCTPNKYASTASGDLSWTVDLYGYGSMHDIYYYAEFQIEGDWYQSDGDVFNTSGIIDYSSDYDTADLDSIDMDLSVTSMGDWTGHDVDAWLKVYYHGGSWYKDGASVEITGTGDYDLTCTELLGDTEWDVEVYIYDDTWDISVSTIHYSIWTQDVQDVPVYNSVSSQFISPYTMRLKADIELNDASAYDCELYFQYKLWNEYEDDYVRTSGVEVDGDGVFYVDLSLWNELEFDESYDFRACLDYEVSTLVSSEYNFHSPELWYGVQTLEPEILSDTQARLRGWFQKPVDAELNSYVRFVYWNVGDGLKKWTPLQIVGTGVFTADIGDLVFGEVYTYQAYFHNFEEYGVAVDFKAGYTGEGGTGTGAGWNDMFNWLISGLPINNIVVKMLIGIIVTGVVGAVLVYKIKGKAGMLIGMFVVTGLTVVFSAVRWYPYWFILLMSLVLVIGFLLVFRGGLGQEE